MPNTAKQEAIRKAWGFEFYEIAKHAINEDGWFERNKDRNLTLLTHFEVNEMRFKGLLIRPRVLDNIENNNGWIRIESEEDLPKESGEYWVYETNGAIGTRFYLSVPQKWGQHEMEIKEPQVSHWQPIVEPEKPIY